MSIPAAGWADTGCASLPQAPRDSADNERHVTVMRDSTADV